MDILKQDAERVASFYHNKGYMDAKVGTPIVEQKDDALVSSPSPSKKAPATGWAPWMYRATSSSRREELLATFKIREEAFLNRQVLREDITRLTDLYAEQGYAFAEVTPKIDKAESVKQVDIRLQVDQGSLVYFNRVEINGNTRTRDNVIRRDLKVQEGGIFDSKAIRTSTQKLQRLGFFEEVSRHPQAHHDRRPDGRGG